jgi:hypothetical protein
LKILRGNQKSSIEVGQTIQCNWKIWRYQGIIKSRPLKKDRPFYYIVLSVLVQWTTFDYPLVSSNLSITLYCLSFFNGRLLITPWYLQTFLLHCIFCPSSMDDFWLPLGIFKPFYYIVLSVPLQWTTFDYPWVSSNISFTLSCLYLFYGDRQYNVIERFEDTKV